MSEKPWWERWPHLLQGQLEALDKAGIKYSLDEEARKNGRMVIHVTYPYEGRDLLLDAIFPDFFPFFRFEVKGLNIDLPRHQNPFQKNLCLIGRSTLNWDIDDALADFLIHRLPNVMRAATSPEPMQEIEELQAEPITDYYLYSENIIFFFDSSWSIDPSVSRGTLELGAALGHQLVILAVRDAAGRLLQSTDKRFGHLFKRGINARWIRSPEAIREGDPRDFRRRLIELDSNLSRPEYVNVNNFFSTEPGENLQMNITGVLFPEEVAETGGKRWHTKDAWVFLVATKKKIDKRGFRPKVEEEVFFVRPGRVGQDDMLARIPEVRNLKDKKIALFGLGCLGAPSAFEFARNGVGELRILDYDVIDPGTVVRWPLGLQAAGRRKAEAVKSFIEASYPYTAVVSENMRLGEVTEQQQARLETFLDGADLIYDATAEFGVQHFLSHLALSKQIPYVCLSATYGAWGGMVARVIPGKTGCWTCLKYWQDQHDQNPSTGIPLPRQDESGGSVQPQGCADPTFTGTSFDTGNIALAGVRLAISTLLEGQPLSYPSFEWDVAIINLRDEDGGVIAPQWETFSLNKHSSCPCSSSS